LGRHFHFRPGVRVEAARRVRREATVRGSFQGEPVVMAGFIWVQ